MIIHFEDKGQDFLTWTLNEAGEVIDCQPHQKWIWNGAKVCDHHLVKEGDNIIFLDKFNEPRTMLYKVVKIEKSYATNI